MIGGKGLLLLGGDERTLRNNFRHHTTNSFNTQSEGSGVDDNQRFGFFRSITTYNTSLDSSAEGYGFIGVDTGIGFFVVEEFLDQLTDFRNTGGTADQNNFVDLALFEAGIFQSLFHRLHGVFEQVSV